MTTPLLMGIDLGSTGVKVLVSDADGAELVVEMTDHESVPSLSLLRPHLDAIRDAGVRVAVHVSSFGTEITRLLMLTNPDVVKLDPPLSAAIVAGGHQTAAARNFFSYCRRHGVFIVAVGVGDGEAGGGGRIDVALPVVLLEGRRGRPVHS